MNFRFHPGSRGPDAGRRLTIFFLLIGVLAPTACVLWFLNVAVNNDRDASRRKLEEAYRGQLKLLRGRVDSWWEKRAADLERESRGASGPVIFERVVRQGLADSVIIPGYPALTAATSADPVAARPDWVIAGQLEGQSLFPAAADSYEAIARVEQDVSIAARAEQARIRCLARAGNKAAAIRAIQENFTAGRLVRGRDLAGRFIAPDEQLLAIRLMEAKDVQLESATRRLHDLVADYAGLAIPSSQRLFLMDELGPGGFPTYAAERLAAQFLEGGRTTPAANALQPAGIADLWKLTPAGTSLIALYRTSGAKEAMRSLSAGLNVALTITPPGTSAPTADEWMPAGSSLPGWQISLSIPGHEFDTSRKRVTTYVWVGLLAIAIVAISSLTAGQLLRRQWRIARLKTDLVAAVSHELKTPVASVRVLVDTLLADDKPDVEKTRDYLELIARENLRLSRLIENFLTFSRLERSRQRFDFAAVEPARVVAAAMTAQNVSEPDLSIVIAPDLPRIRADEDALVTVLRNLLDNAWKYTPGDKRIAIRAYRENARVVFAVEDNGIGIAAREQKRIFRRFYQVDRRLSRDAGGCGLGLSIVEFIVRAHGGAVRVQSQPGRGSTFFVLLPEAT